MPHLAHKVPCKGCPFLRASAAGWLGASNPEEFAVTTYYDQAHMPCHKAIDYEEPDWRENQYPDAPFCAGALIALRNQCILPRDRELAVAVKQVEADRETVFATAQEFIAHHKR